MADVRWCRGWSVDDEDDEVEGLFIWESVLGGGGNKGPSGVKQAGNRDK